MASRIVFLIDWNRARKRLLNFFRKREAIAMLAEAMQALGADAFRIGDRMDEVLGQKGLASFAAKTAQRPGGRCNRFAADAASATEYAGV
ncbi:hypothetical protein LNV23_07600 [Paucibacter sp. DJ1R-11]|uniref:hypothetical protein n=1 Tax=Paucibacter sp. DJ1R-11 TaxID=2893556 RepID=UPI0021E4CD54|nr:hypothetical protein [Paucibacter sp. DJ1R-11]MCV2363312.1 hypothetical protein [Paucibacter sp. DJ1R-11]